MRQSIRFHVTKKTKPNKTKNKILLRRDFLLEKQQLTKLTVNGLQMSFYRLINSIFRQKSYFNTKPETLFSKLFFYLGMMKKVVFCHIINVFRIFSYEIGRPSTVRGISVFFFESIAVRRLSTQISYKQWTASESCYEFLLSVP